jgi:hypothetical protein
MHHRAGSSTVMLFRVLGEFRSWVFILFLSSLLYKKNQTCHRSDMSLGLNWALRLIPHGSWGLRPGVTHRYGFILTLFHSMWLNHNLSQNSMVWGEGAEHSTCVLYDFVSPDFPDPCSKVTPDVIGWLRKRYTINEKQTQWKAKTYKHTCMHTQNEPGVGSWRKDSEQEREYRV